MSKVSQMGKEKEHQDDAKQEQLAVSPEQTAYATKAEDAQHLVRVPWPAGYLLNAQYLLND